MQTLRFSKMHGLGNDFMVVDATRQAFAPDREQVRLLADRHFGVGFDQLLIVEPAPSPAVDFRYRIFNADGGEVEQCGNGARCLMRFVHEQGLTGQKQIRVATAGGNITLKLEADGLIAINMGVPDFDPASLPFDSDSQARLQTLTLADGSTLQITPLSMGNPHAVTIVTDVAQTAVEHLGPMVTGHARFAQGVNAGFMQIIDPHHIALRVHERGAGETLACGSGACAAAACGIISQHLQSPVSVRMPGGTLHIDWAGEGQPLWMRGDAETVFEAQLPWPPTLRGRPSF